MVDGFGANPDSPLHTEGEDPDEEETPVVWAAEAGTLRVARFLQSRGATFPKSSEFEMRYKLSAAVHRERLLAASESDVIEDPFQFNKVSARADLMARREMGAPQRVVEFEEGRVRAMEELSQEPAWEGLDGIDLYREASKIASSLMRDRPGYRDQLKQWDSILSGEDR